MATSRSPCTTCASTGMSSGCGLPSETRTTCPYCGVGCGLVASVEDGRLVSVRGDAEHPVNRGATCRKPTRLPEAVHAPDRATTPLWRGGARPGGGGGGGGAGDAAPGGQPRSAKARGEGDFTFRHLPSE